MATNFWKYVGSEERRYPDWRLTVDPGQVVDFGAGSQPNDGRWVSDPGPATAPPPPVLPGVVTAGPRDGDVPVWDSTSASYKPKALSGSYVQLARTPDALITGTITRDANGAATSAPVTWPDGTPGTYTADTVSSAFPGAVDAYHITYGTPVTKTYTQPLVTRDSNGAATNVPAITVA